MADKGKVDIVRVSMLALRTANNQQVEALWRAADLLFVMVGERLLLKSWGDAGLQKLLDHRDANT